MPKSKTMQKKKKKTVSDRKNLGESPLEITIKRRISGENPEVHHFYLKDGRSLKNINDLIQSFETMSDEVFYHHVNDQRNDFANWITDIIKEDTLANELRSVKTKIETELKLLRYIVKKTLG